MRMCKFAALLAALFASAVLLTAGTPDWRESFRVPRCPAENVARLKAIADLRQELYEFQQGSYKAGVSPETELWIAAAEQEAAKIAWLRAEMGVGYSLGFAEGLSKLKWAKLLLADIESKYPRGHISREDLTKAKINLLELEVKYYRLLHYLTADKEFAKPAEAFNRGKATDATLKALLEAEAGLFKSDRPYWEPTNGT